MRLGGGCEGRWWDISWETREGDIPSMTADGTGLVGSDPMVSVVTMIDGGMWLRPLRGDMLRLPEPSPQVGQEGLVECVYVAHSKTRKCLYVGHVM